MAGTAQGAPEDLLTCEQCHGFYAVEVPADGSDPRVRCNSCGHIREVENAPVKKTGDSGKWTVIGPDGKTRTYPTWEKLVESRRGSAVVADEKKPSASALLDVTPTPTLGLPKLALAELESDPHLVLPTPNTADLAKSVAKSKGPEWAPAKTDAAPPSSEKAPASVAELDAGALMDDNSDDEPAPLSLRDAITDDDADDDAAPLSLRDAIPESLESAVEMVSLTDVQIADAPDSVPPAPARGALRTLPPTPSKKGSAAPPPTITVEEGPKSGPKSARPKAQAEAKPSEAPKKADKGPPKKTSGSATATAKDKDKDRDKEREAPKSARKSSDAKPIASARAAVAEDEPKRGWVLPALAVAGVAIAVWRIMAASPDKTDPTPQQPTATVATPTPTETAPAPTATAEPTSTAAPSATVVTTPPPTATTVVATTEPTATATGKKPRPPAEAPTGDRPPPTEKNTPPPAAEPGALSMSEMLDKAGSARRSGDYATARDLFGKVLKQNPSNVEANGGMGDVARAQGDLGGAKASYERALAASPSYGPAQLGLADTEWDLGNHAGAQRRYAQIVERLGERAPERAKQRAAAE
jgi:tetratricopeptide (TPR) repeat protein